MFAIHKEITVRLWQDILQLWIGNSNVMENQRQILSVAQRFAEKYFRQGLRVAISGRIQTGSYTNKDGVKVYTTDVFVEEQEFAESKSEYNANQQSKNQQNGNQQNGSFASPRSDYGDGFMNIPDGIDEELPFN